MSEDRTGDQRPSAPPQPSPGSGVHWGRLVMLVALLVILGVLVYQNLEAVPIQVLWWEFSIPLVVVVVATAVLTLVIRVLAQTILEWRRRRRDRKTYLRPRPDRDQR